MKIQSEKSKAEYKKLLEATKLAIYQMEADNFVSGDTLSINETLIKQYSIETNCYQFKTLEEWNKEGFKIIAKSAAYRVWGDKSIKCLFNENQVIKVEKNEY